MFVYDWYWYGNAPFLEEALNGGFLRTHKNGKIPFYLMWANHDAITLWELERSDKHELVWPGVVDRQQFEVVVDRRCAPWTGEASSHGSS